LKNIRGKNMDKNKSAKLSLGTTVCLVLILVILLALVYYFGFVVNKNKSNNNISEFKPSNYIIQFNSNILGEKFNEVGNETKDCNYEISFLDNNKFTIYMNFGNYIQGTYTVSNNIINCILTSASGEYSPAQEVSGKISFKINNNSEIEIIDIPESYKIRTTELSENGWILTDETKEMEFWPLIKGIKYVSDK
jgi:hypothetical protein